jgi:hypothetical protein
VEGRALRNTKVIKVALLSLGMLALATVPSGARSSLDMRVSPAVSMEPAFLRIQYVVDPHPDNRAVLITVESSDFFRSSEIHLEGDRAPRTSTIEYRNVPAGVYEISAVLAGSDGRERAVAHRTLTVIGLGS